MDGMEEWSLEDILSEYRDLNPDAEDALYGGADAYRIPEPVWEPEPELPSEPEKMLTAERDVRPMDEKQNRDQSVQSRRRTVIEEFPTSGQPEPEIPADDFDYSVFFRMFAEEQAEEAREVGDDEDGEAPADEAASTDSESEEPPAAEQSGEAPLMAENSPDFRDILRDFMLQDRHPIYADTPGLNAEPVKDAEKLLGSLDLSDADGLLFGAGASNVGEAAVFTDPPEKPAEEVKPRTEEKKPGKNRLAGLLDRFGRKKRDGKNTGQTDGDRPEAEDESEEDDGAEDPVETVLSMNDEDEPEEQVSEKRKKRTYTVEEDFPEEHSSASPDPEPEEALPGFDADDFVSDGSFGDDSDYPEPVEAELPDSTEEEQEEEDLELLYGGDFPSFGQWILNELMNVWIRICGVAGRESTATMDEDSEDLGPEVNVANASRYYGSQVTMLRMRLQIGVFLLAVLAYITLGFPVSGMLKTAKVASAMCLGLQLTILLLCLDVVTNAAVNLTRGKFGADGLAVLCCVISSLDALAVTVGGFGTPHIPLCLFSSMALLGILLASLLSARALRKSIRVPAIGRRAYCVTAEEGVRNNRDITLLKSVRPTAGFVRRAEEAPPDETLFSKAAIFELAAAILLSLLIGLVRHGMKDLLYILSAVLSCAVPVTALISFSLPYFIGSQRIFSSGAAVAGWSGIHDIGSSRNLIVTDRDLFPEDTVAIDTVRIFADESAERIIAYAGTMVAASGSGLGPAFSDLMERNGCRMRTVEDFQWLSGGGLQGRIEGHRVLCGNADVMQLMDVKIPYRLVDRTTLLLAIDGVLYGIFRISYAGLPEVRSALQELIASNRHPIFAIRDFNITPDMLRETFDVATDGYDFPPYGDRFRISEAQPSENSKVAAVVCREGLGPLTHVADTGRSMYVAIRVNLMVTAATAVLGMLLTAGKLATTGLLNVWMPFVLMLISALVTALVSLFMKF
ncbi:MAG: hypothetical protein K6C12_08995 [Oscillospiraceae bacterium]|nr:hypothetical protein [Oscillospiraceae bacterium]